MKTSGLVRHNIGAHVVAVFIEEYVAAFLDGPAEPDVAVRRAVVTIEVPAETEMARAVHRTIECDLAGTEACDGRENLEGGTGRIRALDRTFVPRAALRDFRRRGRAKAGDKLAEIIVRLAGEHEHLAGRHVDRDRGSRHA